MIELIKNVNSDTENSNFKFNTKFEDDNQFEKFFHEKSTTRAFYQYP